MKDSCGVNDITRSDSDSRVGRSNSEIVISQPFTDAEMEPADSEDKLSELSSDVRMSPEAEQGAPPPRRKSFSKLRRRLSQTFRLSFNGSLSEFSQSFNINENGEERSNGQYSRFLFFCSSSFIKRGPRQKPSD